MYKLGIIGAMAEEVETLLSQMCDVDSKQVAGSTFYAGKLGQMDAVVVQCGIGKVNAAVCTQILCDSFGVTHLINTGIAGSLCAELDIADLVVSRDAMYHDVDCIHFGYVPGQMPGMPACYPADEKLISYAFAASESVNPGHTKVGRIASGDQFVCSAEKKAHIIAVTQALCTEMEGAAIAQTAYRNDIPFVILRAISDKADDSAEMDYPTFERLAAHRCAQVTRAFADMLAKE